MATWSTRRKSLIGVCFLIILIGIAIGVYFLIFYKEPTCFDGIRNGGEFGVDCGGRCEKICQSAFIQPKIGWGGGKIEKVATGLYNVAALVVNPNTNVAARNVPYKLALYDSRGLLIIEKTGKAHIPAHRNTLVFYPAINTGERVPTKVIFEFTESPLWFKSHDALEKLAIGTKKYEEDQTGSSLEVTLENKSLQPMLDITVGAVLSDIDGNIIGFSQTLIDEIAPGVKEIAPFTWPIDRKGKVVTIEVLPVVDPIKD